jgi:hypothetical protein
MKDSHRFAEAVYRPTINIMHEFLLYSVFQKKIFVRIEFLVNVLLDRYGPRLNYYSSY